MLQFEKVDRFHLKTVVSHLKYISNEVRRVVTFFSQAGTGYHTSSIKTKKVAAPAIKLNPADYASREIKASETGRLERWRCGPEFS